MASIHVGRSEEEVGEKVDRCLADGLIKTGFNFTVTYVDQLQLSGYINS